MIKYIQYTFNRKTGAKMRILLCDDDILIIEQLQKYIESYFESNHLKCPELVSFTSGEFLLADTEEKDIVFLDIEMPGMNGIYIGNELKRANKNVIIFRYLSKPLDKQRFFRNLKDALSYYNSITAKIPIETKQGVYSLPALQIIAIEAQGRKVIVHTTRQDFVSIYNMNYWIEQLPKNSFFQTHRSFIINFEHVTDFDHTTVHLTNHQVTAYLTRRKYSSFKNAYLLYLESMR